MPENGTFDFRLFSMKWDKSDNFTCRMFEKGHAQFVDGLYTINVLEFDKMLEDMRSARRISLTASLKRAKQSSTALTCTGLTFLTEAYMPHASRGTAIGFISRRKVPKILQRW